MKINGKSTQGIFAYSNNYEYERGDFVIYKDTLYKCIAEKDIVVCNSIPSEDKENFEEYPGSRVRQKEDYEKELSEGVDRYVSSDLLNQVLSDTYFGMNESGLISSKISYEDNKVSYSVRDLNGEYTYGEEPSVLDTILLADGLNNGAVKVSTSLPDIDTLLPPKSTLESFSGYVLTGKVVDYGTGEGVDEVLVSEIIYYVDDVDVKRTGNEVYTDASGEFSIPISSDTSRLKISGPAPYEEKFFDLSDSPTINYDKDTGVVKIPSPIKIQKEGIFYSISGRVTDGQGNKLEGITVSIDNGAESGSWAKVNYKRPLTISEENSIVDKYLSCTANPDSANERKEAISKSIRNNCLYFDDSKTYGVFKFADTATEIISPTIRGEKTPVLLTLPSSVTYINGTGGNFEDVSGNSGFVALEYKGGVVPVGNISVDLEQGDTISAESGTIKFKTLRFQNGDNIQAELGNTGKIIVSATFEIVLYSGTTIIPLWDLTYSYGGDIRGFNSKGPKDVEITGNYYLGIRIITDDSHPLAFPAQAEFPNLENIRVVIELEGNVSGSSSNTISFYKTPTIKNSTTPSTTSGGLSSFVSDIQGRSEYVSNVSYGNLLSKGSTKTDKNGLFTLESTNPIFGIKVEDLKNEVKTETNEGEGGEIITGTISLVTTDVYRAKYERAVSDFLDIKMLVALPGVIKLNAPCPGRLILSNTEDYTSTTIFNTSSGEQFPEEKEGDETTETSGDILISINSETFPDVDFTKPLFLSYFTLSDSEYSSVISSRVLQTSNTLIGESQNATISIGLKKKSEEISESGSIAFSEEYLENAASAILISKYFDFEESSWMLDESSSISIGQGYYAKDQKLVIVAREGYKGGIFNVISTDENDYPIKPLSDSYGYQTAVVDLERTLGYVILRQYTYFDDTNKIYTRVQEIADPQYGNVVYRFARTPGDALDFTNATVSSWRSATNGNMPAREKLMSLENLYTRKCSELESLKESLKESYCTSYMEIENGKIDISGSKYPELNDSMIVTLLIKESKGGNTYKTYSVTFDASDGGQYMIGSTDAKIVVSGSEISVSGTGFSIASAQYKKKFN